MLRQKESYNLYPPLTVANVHLEKSFCVKYLGVYIDCHLTWHDHMDYICGKISKNINNRLGDYSTILTSPSANNC